MKRILITGSRGFLGSRLAEYWRGKYELQALGRQEMDIRDGEQVRRVVGEFAPDYVVHTAAAAVTSFCETHKEEAYGINVMGTKNVAKACKEYGAAMVFCSTEQIFLGNQETGPYPEEQEPYPATEYGKNKWEAEQWLKEQIASLWILRLTWQFDMPRQGMGIAGNILWGTLQRILRGEKLKVPVHEYRGMTYGMETVENMGKVFALPYGTYHMGSENDCSRYEIVEMLLKEIGLEKRIPLLLEADQESFQEKPKDIRIDTTKLRKAGITFSSTAEGIRKCVKDYNLRV